LDFFKIGGRNNDHKKRNGLIISRDIQHSSTSTKSLVTSSEVNKLYDELLQQTKTVDRNILDYLDEETVRNIVGAIQRKVIEINNWIRERLKGKGGILRGGLLSKTIDYSGRANVVGDPSLKLGYIGLPWQIVLKLYEPFTEYQILKNSFNVHVKDMVKEHVGAEGDLEPSELKRFITMVNEQPDVITPTLTDELVRIAEEIVKDKVVLYELLVKDKKIKVGDCSLPRFLRFTDHRFSDKVDFFLFYKRKKEARSR